MRPSLRPVWGLLLALSASGPLRAEIVVVGETPCHRYEWRASTFTPSAQSEAALAVDSEGNILVVWSSRRQQGGRHGVYGQRFTPEGVAFGSETCLTLWARSHQTAPSVALGPRATDGPGQVTGPGGAFLVWQSHAQDGDGGAILARWLDGVLDGGSEIEVNQEWRGDQSAPVTAVSPSGTAVVVWTSLGPRGGPTRVRARLFDADGKPKGDEFSVSARPAGGERSASVTFCGDGTFAVVFGATDGDRRPCDIRLRRFDSVGTPLGNEIVVSDPSRRGQVEPVVAATPEGFLVSWLCPVSDGRDYGVMARWLDREGAPRGRPFVVNTATAGPQTAAAVAVGPDGRVAIAYNGDDGNGPGIFAQLFRSDDCSPIGREFRVNRHVASTQAMRVAAGTRRLAFGRDGALICVWSGDGGSGDASSVNVTMLTPGPLDLAGKQQGATDQMAPAGPLLAAAAGPQPHAPPGFDPERVDREGVREVHTGLLGIGFTAILDTGWFPPDPHLAVGPNHVVVVTNGAIAIFTKAGALVFQDELEDAFGFWGPLGATGFVFDPEVLYDELSGRFFVVATEGFAPGSTSFALVAVSQNSNPTGATWHKYRFETTALAGNVFDSPNIAVDDTVVYITGDALGTYPVFTFDKASLLAGNPPAITRSTTLVTSTQSAGIPPVSFDDPPALYMIEHMEAVTNTSVRLVALTDPLGTPSFTTTILAVPAYGRPEDPPQAGTAVRPETFDARFWSTAYRNGSLWATHHINDDRVLVRWYEVAMNGWPFSGQFPALVQSGEIDLGFAVRTFFGAITVDPFGNAAITFARSSALEPISMATAYRFKSDPLGTLRPPVIHRTNTGPYATGRWGDYGGINIDPTDGKTVWAHHEFAVGAAWRTWVASFTPTFSPGDVNCDGTVNVLDLIELLLCFGQPAAGACLASDINGDGSVNVLDLIELLLAFGFVSPG